MGLAGRWRWPLLWRSNGRKRRKKRPPRQLRTFLFTRNQLATVCAPFAVSFLSVSPPSMYGSPPAGFARVLEKLLRWATMACPAAKSIATRRARKQAGTDKIQRAHLLEPSDVHSRRLLKRQCPTPQEAGLWRCGQAR